MPITGFANSVVAPAIEFHAEGEVFGVGCKIFTIAGPVILYGVLTSWVFGADLLGWQMDGDFLSGYGLGNISWSIFFVWKHIVDILWFF